VNQPRSIPLKKIFSDARNISGRLHLYFPPACSFCHLTTILSILLPRNFAISAYPTCQRLLSECTIIYTTGAAGMPVRLTPKPLVPLRAAFHCVAQVPLRGTGSSTRFDAAALSTAVSAFALPAASTLNSLAGTWRNKLKGNHNGTISSIE
jgi:hypothetical protein